ncbi:hypothetical protein C8R31_101628 [Nitrosospira sp. Nsp2]|uniref:hypothetical protein n=1 Tax=Nitrosospira sp. Nsp2 TaxID=136548 RepID=UPI000D303625|nr:hypothetical protein [Nitrosospira sp. Nsp2]PTR17464.1 hypothetical protein C8R31_101628 [Nitrosospira sp. Nsp2]
MTLGEAKGGREAFEEWADGMGIWKSERDMYWLSWQARQPEIENLCARLGALGVSNTKWKQLHADITKQFLEAQKEIAKLKAALDKVKS